VDGNAKPSETPDAPPVHTYASAIGSFLRFDGGGSAGSRATPTAKLNMDRTSIEFPTALQSHEADEMFAGELGIRAELQMGLVDSLSPNSDTQVPAEAEATEIVDSGAEILGALGGALFRAFNPGRPAATADLVYDIGLADRSSLGSVVVNVQTGYASRLDTEVSDDLPVERIAATLQSAPDVLVDRHVAGQLAVGVEPIAHEVLANGGTMKVFDPHLMVEMIKAVPEADSAHMKLNVEGGDGSVYTAYLVPLQHDRIGDIGTRSGRFVADAMPWQAPEVQIGSLTKAIRNRDHEGIDTALAGISTYFREQGDGRDPVVGCEIELSKRSPR
jgi:hypothetical protein